jgi:pSer/pThr/pTyr-binding forkhead associated (FHA) protein
LKGSNRTEKDGKVYAGTGTKDQSENYINDIVLSTDSNIGERHFVVEYIPDSKYYTLTDLGCGTGTFARIDSRLKLKSNYIISFGESHMLTNVEGNKLDLKFIDGPKAEQTFSFYNDTEEISIGRMVDCNIRFEDHGLSRYQ